MKKYLMSLKLFSVITLSLIFVLSSCNQEELVYSCNPEIDLWVKENKQTIDVMSTNEFLSLERDYQKASYIAFSSKQREFLWVSKITETLQLNWNENEKMHLEKLLVVLKEYSRIFEKDCPEEYKDEFKVWVYQWIKDGEEAFNWSPKLIKNLLSSPNQLLNKDGDIKEGRIKKINYVKTRSENDKDERRTCNCYSTSNQGEGIFFDDCSEYSHCVQGYWDCKPKGVGCGFFFLDPCDGYCW